MFRASPLNHLLALMLSLLWLPFAQSNLAAQPVPPGAYTPLGAMQLDRLVAPVALYPDALLAQVLTASTFANQVNEADQWLHQTDGMPRNRLAASVDSFSWDPSVKALTEFPTVLDDLSRNSGWTTALGNAYYNQPADVMNAVQAMRYEAQQAGTLLSTPQETVFYNDGLIAIDPVDPAVVYVPYYDPWAVYGAPIPAWSGYYWSPRRGVRPRAAIGFGAGIGIGPFARYAWGYHAWSPDWRGGVVAFNHSAYISPSTTVINSGNFGRYDRGVFEHAGRGVPSGYHPAVMAQTRTRAESSNLPQVITTHPGTGQSYHAPANNHPAKTQTYRPPAGATHSGTTSYVSNQSRGKSVSSVPESKTQAQTPPKSSAHGK